VKLHAPGSKAVTLTPVRPSAAVRAWYEGQLVRLVDEMATSVEHWATGAYRRHLAGAAPEGALYHTLELLGKKWHKKFDDVAQSMAEGFVDRTLRHHDLAFRGSLVNAGFGVVAMDAKVLHKLAPIKLQMTKRLKRAVRSKVTENVNLISNVPTQYMHDIETHVARSVGHGRDLKTLTDYMQDRLEITKRRASLIARDQNNKATALIHQVRQLDLGITKAKWVHTGASIHPREDHAAFDGELYDVEEGHDFGDDFGSVLPGEAINCGCCSASVIPGYDDEATQEEAE